jgi:S-adenosylmethionine:tRNA ribosyltransferase-isomerase
LLAVGACALEDLVFSALPELMRPADLLVFNDTRVIKARLLGRKDTGGQVEVMVERIVDEREVHALIRASHPPRDGSRLSFDGCRATVVGRLPAVAAAPGAVPAGSLPLFHLSFPEPVAPLLERIGRLPLPPYIAHPAQAEDEARYQTVYASHPGAVAAPTAGLHFDAALLARLRDKGIRMAMLTLHVGSGTFLPVRTENLADHRMHSERFEIPPQTAQQIAQAREAGGRVIAVGTTSLRALEAAGGRAGQGETDIFITPGYRFAVVDALLTNFHLPKSTLLMLVSAFAGIDTIRRAYAHAIARRYRFFSYGDAMLLQRRAEP